MLYKINVMELMDPELMRSMKGVFLMKYNLDAEYLLSRCMFVVDDELGAGEYGYASKFKDAPLGSRIIALNYYDINKSIIAHELAHVAQDVCPLFTAEQHNESSIANSALDTDDSDEAYDRYYYSDLEIDARDTADKVMDLYKHYLKSKEVNA